MNLLRPISSWHPNCLERTNNARSFRHIVMGVLLGITLTLVVQVSISYYLKTAVEPALQDVQFVNYEVSPFSLEMQLPETATITEDYIYGGEVLYSCFLQDTTWQFWGYVQIWNISNFNDFLSSSKNQSEWDFVSYDKQEIVIDNHRGFIVKWNAEFRQGQTVLAEEYFLQNNLNSRVLRVALMTDQDEFPDELAEALISSVRWHQ